MDEPGKGNSPSGMMIGRTTRNRNMNMKRHQGSILHYVFSIRYQIDVCNDLLMFTPHGSVHAD